MGYTLLDPENDVLYIPRSFTRNIEQYQLLEPSRIDRAATSTIRILAVEILLLDQIRRNRLHQSAKGKWWLEKKYILREFTALDTLIMVVHSHRCTRSTWERREPGRWQVAFQPSGFFSKKTSFEPLFMKQQELMYEFLLKHPGWRLPSVYGATMVLDGKPCCLGSELDEYEFEQTY